MGTNAIERKKLAGITENLDVSRFIQNYKLQVEGEKHPKIDSRWSLGYAERLVNTQVDHRLELRAIELNLTSPNVQEDGLPPPAARYIAVMARVGKDEMIKVALLRPGILSPLLTRSGSDNDVITRFHEVLRASANPSVTQNEFLVDGKTEMGNLNAYAKIHRSPFSSSAGNTIQGLLMSAKIPETSGQVADDLILNVFHSGSNPSRGYWNEKGAVTFSQNGEAEPNPYFNLDRFTTLSVKDRTRIDQGIKLSSEMAPLAGSR